MVVGERKNHFAQTIRFILILAVAAITMYPLLWMISSSFKFEQDIFQQLGLIPRNMTFENYINGWKGRGGSFSLYFKNSFLLVLLATVGNLVSCSLAAFAFARKDFRLKAVMFALMLGTIMLPQHAVIIPQYVMFFKLGVSNSMLPIVLPKFFAVESFFIFLLVQFMRGIPQELDQAAIVDGCNAWGIFSRIIIPLSQPALVTTTIFSFLWTWNDFFPQLVYLTNPKLHTVSLALKRFVDPDVLPAYGQMMAMSTVSIIPILILFALFQRLLIEGISTTGLKF
ncbi:MAG: carbohydrate ABC transporter permease [Sphaerochaetaceae bacterium]|mgnify:CR=1 FL=1|jgi:multiple sugar transport system permease protein|nr:carbohydrate ABC transporter permease [Sphaerochaetaceae bacterium]MDX9809015.1 carbohydrate ABC transporter permease [Sphaerochaetaceae bacterium]